MALTTTIGLEPGVEVRWELLNRGELHLVGLTNPAPAAKSKPRK